MWRYARAYHRRRHQQDWGWGVSDITKNRKHLKDYGHAMQQIELTETAINILERVRGAQPVIAKLKKLQQSQLNDIDSAAEMLGIPYR